MWSGLTGDLFEADFLLDVSNVTRTARDGRASLERLARVLRTLEVQEHDPDTCVYAVADTSLRGHLPGDQRRILDDWRDTGIVEIVPDADTRILELAELTDLRIVSADRFRGHRVLYPWIQGNTRQFFEPHLTPEGRLVVRPIDMGVLSQWEISHYEEQDTLKKQNLLAGPRRLPRRDVLERNWSCSDRLCTLYDVARGSYTLLPRIRNGRATCEVHGLELVDAGPRLIGAQVKVLVNDACVARFTVPANGEVAVGRAPAVGFSLAQWLDSGRGSKVSRHHFTLKYADNELVVVDLSKNGTRISLAPRSGESARMLTLGDGERRPLHMGDRIHCPNEITLTRSGRKFPTELSHWSSGTSEPTTTEGDEPTRGGA